MIDMKRRMNAECVTYLEMDAMRKFNLVQTISVTFLSLSKASSFAKKIFQAIFLFRNFKKTFLRCFRPICLLWGTDSFIMQPGSISQQSLTVRHILSGFAVWHHFAILCETINSKTGDCQTYSLWICSLQYQLPRILLTIVVQYDVRRLVKTQENDRYYNLSGFDVCDTKFPGVRLVETRELLQISECCDFFFNIWNMKLF